MLALYCFLSQFLLFSLPFPKLGNLNQISHEKRASSERWYFHLPMQIGIMIRESQSVPRQSYDSSATRAQQKLERLDKRISLIGN